MIDLLQVMFTCERFRADFPRGMPVRACLRRQLDRQEGAKPGHLGPPRRPFCAESCPLGAEHRAAARDAGVPLEACPVCGSALVGADAQPCATCAARRLDAGKDVPRGELPPPAAPSSRIWTGEVPDVPISAPGAHRKSGPSAGLMEQREARAAERRREFEAEGPVDWASRDAPRHPMCRTTLVNPEEPAEPAEEETMPRGKREKPWPCCGSKSHRHMKGCKEAGGAGGPPIEVPVTRKPGVALAAATAGRRAALTRRAKASEEPDFAYMADEKTDDLVASVGKCKATLAALRAELLRRKTAIDAAIAEVGEEAA